MPGDLAALVRWCWTHGRLVALLALVACLGMGWFAATHLGIDTDEAKMISAELPFRQAEKRMDEAFPQDTDQLVAVLDAPTPELAESGIDKLVEVLRPQTATFRSVRRPAEELFFRRHGLLFLSTDALSGLSERLVGAQPMLGSLARDPSLRGLLDALDLGLEGVAHQQASLEQLTPLINRIDAQAQAIAAGKPPPVASWDELFGGGDQPRRVLLTQPLLRYGQLESGADAAQAIRQAANTIGLTAERGYRLRLTGPVALADANFASVSQGVEISAPLSLLAVCLLLFWAVRSARVVAAILLSLIAGLIATAAFAAATVGTLNPISVAFAVMFVGIAVDFAIQFTVRFRDERFRQGDPDAAIVACAKHMKAPLSLAAVATAVGFLSFLPTAYSGVSQLGLIAGGGMLIALLVDFTLLPALLSLLRPPPEPEAVGLPWAKGDRWLAGHARPVVLAAAGLSLLGAVLLPRLPLDFNPLHLQNPKEEAVSTFLDLAADPESGAYAVDVLTTDPGLAARLDALASVGRVMSLQSFIPEDQPAKLAILADLTEMLGPTLNPPALRPPPSPDELAASLAATAGRLEALGVHTAFRLSPDQATTLQASVMAGLPARLAELRAQLSGGPVTAATLPEDLRRDWISPSGAQRLQVQPKGDMNDQTQLTAFVKAVRGLAPEATGMPVSVEQAGAVVVKAFVQAALTALAAILILLGLMLRRLLDALLVVLPLAMGALFTVIVAVATGLAINFANIIALPLLLGIGVAFNIYFVVNWRQGVTAHLQSATTRAVLFSALTTGSAFGALALSPHLGTASMGLLLFVSLGLSVVTTFLVLPSLFHLMAGRPK